MKILIIKTSSLGDIVHTFPALTDATKMISNIEFDWVVEEAFSQVASWHPAVRQVIPVAIRKWRKNPMRYILDGSIKKFLSQLRQEKYDLVIDAQGLIKSGILTRLSKGIRVGLDKKSLTESLARFAYQKTVHVDLSKQAVFRMRSIFAQALGYSLPRNAPNFGLRTHPYEKQSKNIVFIHGTTWASKHWLDHYWIELAKLTIAAGFTVQLPWYGKIEKQRVDKIQSAFSVQTGHDLSLQILPEMTLDQLKDILMQSRAVIGVDTGLSHIAAALDLPTVTLYGPTSPDRTGTCGLRVKHVKPKFECTYCDKKNCHYKKQLHNEAICMSKLSPKFVWKQLYEFLSRNY